MKIWRIVLGLILATAVMHAYMYFMFSRKRAYDHIRLGDTQRQVQDVFDREYILCGDWLAPGRVASNIMESSCWFTDPWRQYHVTFDKQKGRVSAKTVMYIKPLAKPRSILLRFIARITQRRSPR